MYKWSIDVLKDNSGDLYLIDISNSICSSKEKKIWNKTLNKQDKCEWGVYCNIVMDIGELFEDDDDFNPNIVFPGVKKQLFTNPKELKFD